VLGIDDQVAVFDVKSMSKGDHTVEINKRLEVHDLRILETLEFRRKEIKQLIREGLEENANFTPFEDGGIVDNPNTISRWNIISFESEFKQIVGINYYDISMVRLHSSLKGLVSTSAVICAVTNPFQKIYNF
jgi:hypothetical protein